MAAPVQNGVIAITSPNAAMAASIAASRKRAPKRKPLPKIVQR